MNGNPQDELPREIERGETDLISFPRELEQGSAQFEQFRTQLALRIAELLQNNFSALQAILYRLDVDERQASEAFALKRQDAVAMALTDAILTRQVEREQTRRKREQRRSG